MASLGRMVDEALSGVGEMPEVTNAPTRTSRTASAEGYGPRVLGGGALHQAVEDICWIYQSRDLAENLHRYGWREARRRVTRQGPLEKEWSSHRGGNSVRLTRSGVEVKVLDGIEALNWKRMQSQIRARRS
jgi:hypothetical protein